MRSCWDRSGRTSERVAAVRGDPPQISQGCVSRPGSAARASLKDTPARTPSCMATALTARILMPRASLSTSANGFQRGTRAGDWRTSRSISQSGSHMESMRCIGPFQRHRQRLCSQPSSSPTLQGRAPAGIPGCLGIKDMRGTGSSPDSPSAQSRSSGLRPRRREQQAWGLSGSGREAQAARRCQCDLIEHGAGQHHAARLQGLLEHPKRICSRRGLDQKQARRVDHFATEAWAIELAELADPASRPTPQNVRMLAPAQLTNSNQTPKGQTPSEDEGSGTITR